MAEHVCSWCLENTKVENPDPDQFCLVCNKFLCNECADYHRSKHKHNVALKTTVIFCEVCNIAPVCAFCFGCETRKLLCDLCATKHNSSSETACHELEFHDREKGITVACCITSNENCADNTQGNAGASSNEVSQHNHQYAVYSDCTHLAFLIKEENRGKCNVSEKDDVTQPKHHCETNPETSQPAVQDGEGMSDEYVSLSNVHLTISNNNDVSTKGLTHENKNTLDDTRKESDFEKKYHPFHSNFRKTASTNSNDKTKISATPGSAAVLNVTVAEPHFGEEHYDSIANVKTRDVAPIESANEHKRTEPHFEEKSYESVESLKETAASTNSNDKTNDSATGESSAKHKKTELHFGEKYYEPIANAKTKDDTHRESANELKPTEFHFEGENYETVEPQKETAASTSSNDKTKDTASKESISSSQTISSSARSNDRTKHCTTRNLSEEIEIHSKVKNNLPIRLAPGTVADNNSNEDPGCKNRCAIL